jgi:hypothetical protein
MTSLQRRPKRSRASCLLSPPESASYVESAARAVPEAVKLTAVPVKRVHENLPMVGLRAEASSARP